MIPTKLYRPSVLSALTNRSHFSNPSFHRLVPSVSFSSSSRASSTQPGITNRADPFGENKIASHRLSRLDLEFLGSGSFSTRFRFASSIFLHLDKGDTWLFDAPDGAVRQSNLVTHRNFCHIRKIFISSFMNDTFMGLPNLIASRLMSSPEQLPNKLSLEVYGPPGIISYLQQTLPFALRGQSAHLLSFLSVIELNFTDSHLNKLAKESIGNFPWASEMADTLANSKHNMFTGGDALETQTNRIFKAQRIFADEETGFWTLMDDNRCTLTAGLVGSCNPTFGFVFQESSQFANIPSEQVSFIRSQYDFPVDALSKIKLGKSVPMRKRSPRFNVNRPSHDQSIQDVPEGEEVMISAQDLGLKRIMGRKLCIVNSGSDASPLVAAARNCDVLVHPVSMPNQREDEARQRSMSTAELTVTAACQVLNAKRLLLTRLSSHHAEEIEETMAAWTTRFDRVSKHIFFAKDGALVSMPTLGFNKDDITEAMEITFPILESTQHGNNGYNHQADANGGYSPMGVNMQRMIATDHANSVKNSLQRAKPFKADKNPSRPKNQRPPQVGKNPVGGKPPQTPRIDKKKSVSKENRNAAVVVADTVTPTA